LTSFNVSPAFAALKAKAKTPVINATDAKAPQGQILAKRYR
jgi:hypothetical protein